MNKARAAKVLREWIEIGNGVDLLIVDSPHQNKDYAPYVVVELLMKTPVKQIPHKVLERIENELIEECEPKVTWISKLARLFK